MEIISVIVPVYNVKPYLKLCVNSILKQTYKNLDIILVDDGSTDGSGEMCDEYLNIDKRIRVFHKKNGGLSDARNYGIKRAKGELITFVDSDDFIAPQMHDILYNNMKNESADISICNSKLIWSTEEAVSDNNNNNYEILSSKEALKIMLTNRKFQSSAWDKLYKKSLFNNIEYPIGRIYEDIATTYKLIHNSNKIIYSSYIGYYYFQRSGSIIHSKFNKKQLDMILAYDEMIKYFEDNSIDLINEVLAMYVNANVIVFKEMSKDKYVDYDLEKYLKNNIKKYLKIYIESKEFSKKHKLFAIASIYSPKLFKITCSILKKLN